MTFDVPLRQRRVVQAGAAVSILALAAFILAAAGPPEDCAAEWARLMNQAKQFFQAGDYPKAERRLTQALRISEEPGFPPDFRVLNLAELAVTVCDRGRLREAQKLFLQALEICERLPDADSYCKAPLLGGLAAAYIDTDEYARAEALLRQALPLAKSAGSLPVQVRLHLHMAAVDRYRGNLAEAEASLRRAITLTEQSGGRKTEEMAVLLTNLAVVHQDTGRVAASVPLLEQAISLMESIFGLAHPSVVRPRANLAVSLSLLGRHKEALAAASKAAAVAENAYGSEHFITGHVWIQCATVLRNAGRKREAGRLEKRAREILARHERENLTGHTVDAQAFQAHAGSGAKQSAEPRR